MRPVSSWPPSPPGPPGQTGGGGASGLSPFDFAKKAKGFIPNIRTAQKNADGESLCKAYNDRRNGEYITVLYCRTSVCKPRVSAPETSLGGRGGR